MTQKEDECGPLIIQSFLVKTQEEGSKGSLYTCAEIFEQSMTMGARNQVGLGFSYRPARLHRLSRSILWNRFLGFIEV